MMDLCSPLLNGRHLVLDLSQLLLEGVLSFPGACNDSKPKPHQQELRKHTELTRGDLGNLTSITTWRSAVASLAFCSATSNIFFSAAASFCAYRAMATLTHWISCAASN
jgi:hypothetical protein